MQNGKFSSNVNNKKSVVTPIKDKNKLNFISFNNAITKNKTNDLNNSKLLSKNFQGNSPNVPNISNNPIGNRRSTLSVIKNLQDNVNKTIEESMNLSRSVIVDDIQSHAKCLHTANRVPINNINCLLRNSNKNKTVSMNNNTKNKIIKNTNNTNDKFQLNILDEIKNESINKSNQINNENNNNIKNLTFNVNSNSSCITNNKENPNTNNNIINLNNVGTNVGNSLKEVQNDGKNKQNIFDLLNKPDRKSLDFSNNTNQLVKSTDSKNYIENSKISSTDKDKIGNLKSDSISQIQVNFSNSFKSNINNPGNNINSLNNPNIHSSINISKNTVENISNVKNDLLLSSPPIKNSISESNEEKITNFLDKTSPNKEIVNRFKNDKFIFNSEKEKNSLNFLSNYKNSENLNLNYTQKVDQEIIFSPTKMKNDYNQNDKNFNENNPQVIEDELNFNSNEQEFYNNEEIVNQNLEDSIDLQNNINEEEKIYCNKIGNHRKSTYNFNNEPLASIEEIDEKHPLVNTEENIKESKNNLNNLNDNKDEKKFNSKDGILEKKSLNSRKLEKENKQLSPKKISEFKENITKKGDIKELTSNISPIRDKLDNKKKISSEDELINNLTPINNLKDEKLYDRKLSRKSLEMEDLIALNNLIDFEYKDQKDEKKISIKTKLSIEKKETKNEQKPSDNINKTKGFKDIVKLVTNAKNIITPKKGILQKNFLTEKLTNPKEDLSKTTTKKRASVEVSIHEEESNILNTNNSRQVLKTLANNKGTSNSFAKLLSTKDNILINKKNSINLKTQNNFNTEINNSIKPGLKRSSSIHQNNKSLKKNTINNFGSLNHSTFSDRRKSTQINKSRQLQFSKLDITDIQVPNKNNKKQKLGKNDEKSNYILTDIDRKNSTENLGKKNGYNSLSNFKDNSDNENDKKNRNSLKVDDIGSLRRYTKSFNDKFLKRNYKKNSIFQQENDCNKSICSSPGVYHIKIRITKNLIISRVKILNKNNLKTNKAKYQILEELDEDFGVKKFYSKFELFVCEDSRINLNEKEIIEPLILPPNYRKEQKDELYLKKLSQLQGNFIDESITKITRTRFFDREKNNRFYSMNLSSQKSNFLNSSNYQNELNKFERKNENKENHYFNIEGNMNNYESNPTVNQSINSEIKSRRIIGNSKVVLLENNFMIYKEENKIFSPFASNPELNINKETCNQKEYIEKVNENSRVHAKLEKYNRLKNNVLNLSKKDLRKEDMIKQEKNLSSIVSEGFTIGLNINTGKKYLEINNVINLFYEMHPEKNKFGIYSFSKFDQEKNFNSLNLNKIKDLKNNQSLIISHQINENINTSKINNENLENKNRINIKDEGKRISFILPIENSIGNHKINSCSMDLSNNLQENKINFEKIKNNLTFNKLSSSIEEKNEANLKIENFKSKDIKKSKRFVDLEKKLAILQNNIYSDNNGIIKPTNSKEILLVNQINYENNIIYNQENVEILSEITQREKELDLLNQRFHNKLKIMKTEKYLIPKDIEFEIFKNDLKKNKYLSNNIVRNHSNKDDILIDNEDLREMKENYQGKFEIIDKNNIKLFYKKHIKGLNNGQKFQNPFFRKQMEEKNFSSYKSSLEEKEISLKLERLKNLLNIEDQRVGIDEKNHISHNFLYDINLDSKNLINKNKGIKNLANNSSITNFLNDTKTNNNYNLNYLRSSGVLSENNENIQVLPINSLGGFESSKKFSHFAKLNF